MNSIIIYLSLYTGLVKAGPLASNTKVKPV